MSYYCFRRLEKENRDKAYRIAAAFLLLLVPSMTASIMAVVIVSHTNPENTSDEQVYIGVEPGFVDISMFFTLDVRCFDML